MSVLADIDDNTATSATSHCFPPPDSLLLELCITMALPAWVNPLLDELIALLAVSRTIGATTPGCLSAPLDAA
jgi:hypothetical protein